MARIPRAVSRWPTQDAPPGWFYVPTERRDQVGQWISPGSLARRGNVHGLLIIESKPAVAGARADVFAQEFADKAGGQVTNDTLGGERAWRIGTNLHADAPDLETVDALVVLHNKRIIILSLLEMPDYSYHHEFDFVRDHWKWMPVSP